MVNRSPCFCFRDTVDSVDVGAFVVAAKQGDFGRVLNLEGGIEEHKHPVPRLSLFHLERQQHHGRFYRVAAAIDIVAEKHIRRGFQRAGLRKDNRL